MLGGGRPLPTEIAHPAGDRCSAPMRGFCLEPGFGCNSPVAQLRPFFPLLFLGGKEGVRFELTQQKRGPYFSHGHLGLDWPCETTSCWFSTGNESMNPYKPSIPWFSLFGNPLPLHSHHPERAQVPWCSMKRKGKIRSKRFVFFGSTKCETDSEG